MENPPDKKALLNGLSLKEYIRVVNYLLECLGIDPIIT